MTQMFVDTKLDLLFGIKSIECFRIVDQQFISLPHEIHVRQILLGLQIKWIGNQIKPSVNIRVGVSMYQSLSLEEIDNGLHEPHSIQSSKIHTQF